MTNEQIIFNERLQLMESIVIGNTGRTMVLELENGKRKKIFEPEEIHTYQGWKTRNRQVQKGEKAIASFRIWKHAVDKSKEKDGEEQEKMFMTKASFFRKSQTKAIEE